MKKTYELNENVHIAMDDCGIDLAGDSANLTVMLIMEVMEIARVSGRTPAEILLRAYTVFAQSPDVFEMYVNDVHGGDKNEEN